jgi:hypothetical protein
MIVTESFGTDASYYLPAAFVAPEPVVVAPVVTAPPVVEEPAPVPVVRAPAPPVPETRASRLHERRRRHTRARVAVAAGVACAVLAVSAGAFALRQGATANRPTLVATTAGGNFDIGHADASAATTSTTVRTATATVAASIATFDGNACALVRATDVSSVLGQTVRASPTPDAFNDCNYLSRAGIIGEITVLQGMDGTTVTAADFDRLVEGAAGDQQVVSGLGERAVLIGGATDAVLFVLRRGVVVQFVVRTHDDVVAREQQLARLALARLG